MAFVNSASFVLFARVIVCANVIVQGSSSVTMLSEEQVQHARPGDTVTLECEFSMAGFNLFDNPIIWEKIQGEERSRVNIMRIIADPFFQTKRFDVSIDTRPPNRYVLALEISNVTVEDSANYTCEVRGKKSKIESQVTHSLVVHEQVESLYLMVSGYDSRPDPSPHLRDTTSTHQGLSANPRSTVIASQSTSVQPTQTIELSAGEPAIVKCIGNGGYPAPRISIFLDRLNISSQFRIATESMITGSLSFRKFIYTTTFYTQTFIGRIQDHGLALRCIANVDGMDDVIAQAQLFINYSPFIRCSDPKQSSSLDKDLCISCQVSSRPAPSTIFWMVNANDGTAMTRLPAAEGEYWTLVRDIGGQLETSICMKMDKSGSLQMFSLISENTVGTASYDVQFMTPMYTAAELQTNDDNYAEQAPSDDPEDGEGAIQNYHNIQSAASKCHVTMSHVTIDLILKLQLLIFCVRADVIRLRS